MRKLLALTLTLASLGLFAASAEAKPMARSISPAQINAAPQWRNQRRWDRRDDRRDDRRVRIVTQTRLVRFGRQLYRETYQVRYLPNGRTQTRLISRVRVR